MNRGLIWFEGLVLVAGLLLLGAVGTAGAQTTAFAYQGKLTDAGNPANGNYDLQFKLFDTPGLGTGTQQGATVVVNPTTASAGIFTVTLDFGQSVFDGSDRYLEIGVRPGGSLNAYTLLSPRQQITSSPYAIQTINTQQLGGLPASRYLATDANGNVGIGTSSPTSKVEIVAQAAYDGLAVTGLQPTITLRDIGNSGPSHRSVIQNYNGNFYFVPDTTLSGTTKGYLFLGDNIGIETDNPAHRLHVKGGPPWTSNGWKGAVAFSNASAIAWEANALGNSFGIGQTNGGLYFFKSSSPPGDSSTPANYQFIITDSGSLLESAGGTGLLKAGISVDFNGAILNCYNGVTGIVTSSCGFSVTHTGTGSYKVNLGFAASYFGMVTPSFSSSVGASYGRNGDGTLTIFTYRTDMIQPNNALDAAFVLISF
jgi:hypothetical protein